MSDNVINSRMVGTEFVRTYYTMLHERPDCLHLFFTQDSSYIHGGTEKSGEELSPVRGQAGIRDKIASFHFHDCRTKIRQVDCQETIGNAVLVQVSGELSNNGEPMRRFMQSFVLVPQTPKQFYVHNDIFRYQDEVFADGETLSEEQTDGDVKTEEIENSVNGLAEEAEVAPSHSLAASEAQNDIQQPGDQLESTSSPVESSTAAAPEVKPIVAAAATVEEEKPQQQQILNVSPSPAAVEPAAAVAEPEKKEKEPEGIREPEKEILPQVIPQQKPFSWASLASKNATPSASATTVVPKPQAAIKPERKAEMPVSSAVPLPQRTPRSARTELSGHGEPDRNKWTPVEGEDSGPRGARSSYPDNQQLFVGNLPHSVTDKELQEFFEQYGNVVEVKINRKGSQTNLPNFGFVVFENTEAVEKAMKSKPLMLYGKHRINIEEKKDHAELGNRSRMNSRGRGGGGFGRGGFTNRASRGSANARPSSGGSATDLQQ